MRKLSLILAQLLAGAGTFRFRMFQALTQFIVEIVIGILHTGRIGIAEVCAALYHFRQGKGLLFSLALGGLGLHIVLL
ncbi:hypothetical protein D3C80_2068960 [compost metagenome]